MGTKPASGVCVFTLACLGACSFLVDTGRLAGNDSPAPASDVSEAGSDVASPRVDWLDAAWSARRVVDVPAARVTGSLEAFPLFVDLTPLDGPTLPRIDGADFRFTAADGKTILPHELVAPREAWVRVPNVSDAADTRIYVYYGDPEAQKPAGNATWTGRYDAVWHLDEAAPPFRDATDFRQDGNASVVVPASGLIGGAAQFGGSSEINFAMSPGIGIADNYSIEGWVYPDVSGAAILVDGDIGVAVTIQIEGAQTISSIAYQGCMSASWPDFRVRSSGIAAPGTWTHFVLVTKGTSLAIYLNGVRDHEKIIAATSVSGKFGNLHLGRLACSSPGLVGRLDEVRITKRALDPGWIRTEFENQSSPRTFTQLGAEELR